MTTRDKEALCQKLALMILEAQALSARLDKEGRYEFRIASEKLRDAESDLKQALSMVER